MWLLYYSIQQPYEGNLVGSAMDRTENQESLILYYVLITV